MRSGRNFDARPAAEREYMLENTWCGVCRAADLGMIEPREYEEGGQVFLEGRCRRCGGRVVSELTERRVDT